MLPHAHAAASQRRTPRLASAPDRAGEGWRQRGGRPRGGQPRSLPRSRQHVCQGARLQGGRHLLLAPLRLLCELLRLQLRLLSMLLLLQAIAVDQACIEGVPTVQQGLVRTHLTLLLLLLLLLHASRCCCCRHRRRCVLRAARQRRQRALVRWAAASAAGGAAGEVGQGARAPAANDGRPPAALACKGAAGADWPVGKPTTCTNKWQGVGAWPRKPRWRRSWHPLRPGKEPPKHRQRRLRDATCDPFDTSPEGSTGRRVRAGGCGRWPSPCRRVLKTEVAAVSMRSPWSSSAPLYHSRKKLRPRGGGWWWWWGRGGGG